MNKNWLEWTVFGLSLLLIGVVIGVLGREALSASNTPPLLNVELGSPEQRGDSYMVPITVRNTGDHTAEQVIVEVTLEGVETETSELDLAYVPRGSQREGWAVFTQDPTQGQLSGRVLAFEQP